MTTFLGKMITVYSVSIQILCLNAAFSILSIRLSSLHVVFFTSCFHFYHPMQEWYCYVVVCLSVCDVEVLWS